MEGDSKDPFRALSNPKYEPCTYHLNSPLPFDGISCRALYIAGQEGILRK